MNKILRNIKVNNSSQTQINLSGLVEKFGFMEFNQALNINIIYPPSAYTGQPVYYSLDVYNESSRLTSDITKFEYFILSVCYDDLKGSEIGNYFKSYHEFHYNYYNKKYEDLLINNIEEKQLPNLYFIQKSYDNLEEFKKTFSSKEKWDGTTGKENKNFITRPPLYNIDNYLSSFPFYCKIQFDSHKKINGGFLDFLKDNQLITTFFESYEAISQNLVTKADVTSMNNNSIFPNINLSAYSLGNENIFVDLQKQKPYEFNTFLDKHRLTVNDILEEIDCYSEVIGYKIKKFRTKNVGDGTPVYDTVYIPNNGQSTNTYIDTEILINKNYTYKIYAIVFTIGSKLNLETIYEYSAEGAYDQDSKGYINEVAPNIFEVQISQFSNLLCLEPPLPPQVEILPYAPTSNKENKTEIKFNFTLSSGQKLDTPLMIDAEITNQLQNIRSVQQRDDEKILYSSDDQIKEILIYRLDQPPLSFDDFKSIQEIEITQRKNYGNYKIILPLEQNGILYKSLSLADKIVSNKKFYYTFRTRSIHEYLSNPEIVYEIEFLEDKGNIYPSIKIHDFKKELIKNNKSSASFAKNFLVEPAPVQRIIDPNSSPVNVNYDNNTFSGIIPGMAEKGIWNKKMKFRIISKSTGKKIDINIIFDYKLGK